MALMNEAPALDIVTVVILVLDAFLDGRMAQVLGAYTVILCCAMTGSALALSRKPPYRRRLHAVLFLFWATLTAIVCTVPLAEYVAQRSNVPARTLFGPAALALSRYGEDCWKWAACWVRVRLALIAERWKRGRS